VFFLIDPETERHSGIQKTMKTQQTYTLSRGILAAVGGFALFTSSLHAAPFIYGSGDLVLAFRQTGNATDYAVNIGKATNYNNVPLGTSFAVANLSVAQLGSFPSYNELKWSAAAANRLVGQNLSYPLETLWVTRARSTPGAQSTPWLRKSQFTQANTGAQVDGVGQNAAIASSSLPGNANNTVAGVVIPVANNPNISTPLGTAGNYAGNFQGTAETLTAGDFDASASNVSRADLYELLPGSGNGRYLGYFELKPDGTLTFNNTVPLPPSPTITSIARTGDVTTVSFTTVSTATYRLRTASALGTPVATWAIGPSIAGTGSVLSLSDTNNADIRFFAVDAQ
jgi:hypothetical protein